MRAAPRIAGILLILLGTQAHSQEPSDTPTITMDVNRVVLYATVREGKARFVGDLEQQNFTILEDGVPQKILSFSRDDLPVAIGLLVDNSQSMMNKRGEVVAAAKAFIRASNPGDQIFVVHFSDTIRFALPSDVPFTGDQKLLDAALDTMELEGKTSLYDAIHEGLKHLSTSRLTKKALIVISDGGDNLSKHKSSDVVKEADLSGALFYAIGIYDPMDGDADPGVLKRLAQATGGESYFPNSIQEVKGLCETVARDLRSQYMISYAGGAGQTNSNFHKIQIKVKDPHHRKLIVRARTGYFTPPATSEPAQVQKH